MLRVYIIIIVITISCTIKNEDCKLLKKDINYQNIIYETRNKIVDLTWIEEPMTNPLFASLSKHSECYVDEGINMLSNNKNDKTIVGLVLWSMSGLNSVETLNFAYKIIDYIDEDNLVLWLYGGYGNSNFIENCKNDDYLKFLKICLKRFKSKTNEINALIEGKVNSPKFIK